MLSKNYIYWIPVLVLGATCATHVAAADAALNFDRDIRPILSDNCFHCHGPDAATRMGGIRLDTKEGAFSVSEGVAVIAPGNPDLSELIRRIESSDPADQMPPPEAKKKFSDADRALLRQWIAEGAPWADHWALVPPVKPPLPQPTVGTWPRNPIDHFVAAKLDELGLAPAPEASRRTLIRRLSLDLTGLPPTPAEVDLFLADTADSAYERLVDRLLASPRYGERMAWPWLDAARYSDTNGYQGDGERTMYPWRDWVVNAFNDNMPYDQFTIEQLAGDLLPEPTRDQKLATAFNRNHMINGEGGRIAEENRVEYIFDQLETVGTVWMGLTMNCSRCHDHKYDPLTQADYYQFFAFFNQTPVEGGGGDPRTPPNLPIHSTETEDRIANVQYEADAIEAALAARRDELAPGQAAWELELSARIANAEKAWSALTIVEAKAEGQTLALQEDGSILASGANPNNDSYTIQSTTGLGRIRALRLEALRHESMTEGGLARSDSGNFVLTDFRVTLQLSDGTEKPLNVASAVASFEQSEYGVAKAFDDDPKSGWSVYAGRPFDRGHEAVFQLEAPIYLPPKSTIKVELAHASDHAKHNLGRFRLSVSDALDAKLGDPHRDLQVVLAKAVEARSEREIADVAAAYLRMDDRYREQDDRRYDLRKELSVIDARAIKVMVMAERTDVRETFILKTGLYNQPLNAVKADVPGFLFDMPSDAARNRLGLAQWLMDPQHPLTARVTVNRLWAEFFGQGLVKTTENFGVQGEMPSHPELLDLLAVTFVESGWDVKALVRLMVTSATYRQSSDIEPHKNEVDGANKYLARGPRFRMPSWMIRDQALAAGGLLVSTMGGPSVKPYQPEGLWQEFSFGKLKYEPGKGDDLYRRSIYTYWRRIVAPPMFFDASTRQTCSVKAPRTNTPLHALATLNDPTYVEAARTMAEHLLLSPGATDATRIDTAFRLALSRPASDEEITLLSGSLARLRAEFGNSPQAAQTYVAVGDSVSAAGLDTVEHAAYAALCLSILNTDEALTKE